MFSFLLLFSSEFVSFAQRTATQQLRSDRRLVQYVTRTATTLIEGLRNEPEYKQVAHSRRCLKNLTDISKLIYEKCIQRLPELWNSFDVPAAYLSAECFRQALITANSVFKRKFSTFLKEVDSEFDRDDNTKKITAVIQNAIEAAIKDEDLADQLDGSKIPVVLFQCLEILYEFIPYEDKMCMESYHWIFKFCQTYELKSKDLAIANKLLFTQRMRTHTGSFFTTIATGLKNIFQKISEDDDDDPQFELKSISEALAEATLMHFLNVLRKQILDVEYFITKARSINAKIKVTSEDDHEQCVQLLKTTERSICSQLIHISGALLRLTNACIPLGTLMDSLVRILMEFYICATNLTKHFVVRHTTIAMSFQGTK